METTIKNWGNSLAVILPKEMVEIQKLEAKDKIDISVEKLADLSWLVGFVKTKKSTQEIMDEMNEGWN